MAPPQRYTDVAYMIRQYHGLSIMFTFWHLFWDMSSSGKVRLLQSKHSFEETSFTGMESNDCAEQNVFRNFVFCDMNYWKEEENRVQPGQDKYSRWGFRAFLHLDQSCGSRDPTNRTVWSLSKSLIHISFQHYTNGTVCSNWQMLQKISDHISGAVDRVKAFFNYWLKLRKKYSIAWRSTVI